MVLTILDVQIKKGKPFDRFICFRVRYSTRLFGWGLLVTLLRREASFSAHQLLSNSWTGAQWNESFSSRMWPLQIAIPIQRVAPDLKGTKTLKVHSNWCWATLYSFSFFGVWIHHSPFFYSFWQPSLSFGFISVLAMPRLYTWRYAAKVVELGELSRNEIRDKIPDDTWLLKREMFEIYSVLMVKVGFL